MKKLLIGVVVLFAVIGGGLFYVYSNLDAIIQTAVEEAGSEVTKVTVSLAGVELDLPNGKAAMNGLQVANPDGFKTDYAISLGGVAVEVDPASVGGDVILVKEVVVSAPKVIYELSGTDSNVATIQKNVESFTNAVGAGGSSGSESGSGGGEGPKLVIENLYIRGGEVAVSAGFLEGKKMGVGLPEIHLTDIGKDSGGASSGEVAAQVLDALTGAVTTSVASLNLDSLMEGAGAVLEGAGSIVNEVGEGVGAGEAVEGASDAVSGAVEDAAGAIKGLLGD